MFDVGRAPSLQLYGDNVKAGIVVKKLMKLEIAQGNFADLALLFRGNGGEGGGEKGTFSGLYLRENQDVINGGNDVDLTVFRCEVGFEYGVAPAAQKIRRSGFTALAKYTSIMRQIHALL